MAERTVVTKLREMIKCAGKTHLQLAQAASVSRPYITAFVNGHRGGNLELLEQLANGLGYDVVLVKRCEE